MAVIDIKPKDVIKTVKVKFGVTKNDQHKEGPGDTVRKVEQVGLDNKDETVAGETGIHGEKR